MATIYIQKRKGQKTQRTVNSVEELDVVLRGLANKDRISADGSRWYQKRKLRGLARDALIREAGLSESQISDSGGTASAGAEVSTEGGDGTAGKATPPTVPAPDRAKEAAPRRTSTKKAPPPQDPEVLKQLQNIQQGLVSLADAVDGKADRDQVGPAVEEAVREMGAPLEQRVTNLLSDVQVQLDRVQKGLLREEEVLEEVEGQWGQMEQLVRRCRPGRVQELEQQVDALRDEADRHRAELTERNTIIDRLERELDRLKLAGGEQSLEDEERKLRRIDERELDAEIERIAAIEDWEERYKQQDELDKKQQKQRDRRKEILEKKREGFEEEYGVGDMRIEVVESTGDGQTTPLVIILFFLGLAMFTAGGFMAMRGTVGFGRWAYVVIVAVGLIAGGLGVAMPHSIPSMTDARVDLPPVKVPVYWQSHRRPTTAEETTLGEKTKKTKEVREEPTTYHEPKISNEELCDHVYEIFREDFKGQDMDIEEVLPKSEFIPDCIDSIGNEGITEEAKRCIMRAKTRPELEDCL